MSTGHGIVVREATLDEARVVHEQIPEFDPDYIDANLDRLGIVDKNPHIVVAETDQAAAGYMVSYDRTDAPNTMHIWLTGVTPEHRRHGVLQAMVTDAASTARERGHNRLTVKSDKGRFGSMVSALGRLGFEHTTTDGNSVRFALSL